MEIQSFKLIGNFFVNTKVQQAREDTKAENFAENGWSVNCPES
jgi:hypothetical protein